MKRLIKIFIGLIIIAFGLLSYIGPRMIVEIDNIIVRSLKVNSPKLPIPRDYDLDSKQITLKTHDNLNLKGYLIKTNSEKQKGTIILVHGIRSCKEAFLSVCKLLDINGYNSVLIDLRAHGESGGKYCTFGYYEKEDISALIDTLSNRKDLNQNIGIWGQSLGGAIALQSLAKDKRIKFGVIESTFSDFRTIVNDYTKNTSGFNIPLLTNFFIWRAERLANLNADEIIPHEIAKDISQPIIMTHGKRDNRIKVEYGLQNFNNLGSKDKEFIEFKEGTHTNIWQIGGEKYFDKIISFFDRVSNSTIQ